MKISGMMVLGIMVLILVTAGLGYLLGAGTVKSAANESIPTITVDGKATKTLSPDLLIMSFSAEGFGNTTALAQSNASAAVSTLKSALLSSGVKESEIETSSFYTYPVYNYSKKCRYPYYADDVAYESEPYPGEYEEGYDVAIAPYPYPDCQGELIGYNAVHTISVKTEKINDGGKIADAAVSDSVDLGYVYFSLKESTRISVESELEAEAAKAAKAKADGIASGLGVKVGKLISVQTDDYYPWDDYYMRPMPAYAEAGVSESSDSGTELFPTSLELQNTITVVYELEQ